MINTIFNKIIGLLKTLRCMKGVYEYPQNNPKGYPYCYIDWKSSDAVVFDSGNDRIDIEYKITMVQENMEEFKGRKEAETTIRNRQWKLEEIFRKNNNLGLACVLRTTPTSSIKRYQDNRIITETTIVVQCITSIK